MVTAVVLFTRDLRVHDHPALAAACANAERVAPLFVFDPALTGRSANRDRFLHQSVADLRTTLRARGGDLVVRNGDPVTETIALARSIGATMVGLAADVSAYARRRERRLAAECERHRLALRLFPGVTVVDPGLPRPEYRVFTPYHRAWQAAARRAEVAAPPQVTLPDGLAVGRLPAISRGDSPDAVDGGETTARRRLTDWLRRLDPYDESHDDLAADATSRLSPYLRFGCLSPLEVANAARDHPAFVRQLCWRDFFLQLLAARPELARSDLRPGPAGWRGVRVVNPASPGPWI